MMKYQDMQTGQEWHFDDGVDIDALQNVPKTLTKNIIPRPDEFHDWNGGGWTINNALVNEANNARILLEILEIEEKQLRSTREMLLNPSNDYAKAKLADMEAQIILLRAQLV